MPAPLSRRVLLVLSFLAALPAAAQQPLQSVSESPFTVRYQANQQRLATRVLAMARAARVMPGIADSLWRTQNIEIVLAPSEAAFREITGGRVPEWGAGVAAPEQGVIVLPAWGSIERGGPLDYIRVLRHELAHIALHRAVQARGPRWFEEGYASYAAGELDWDRAWLLRVAFVTGKAPPLDSLALSWPRTSASAQLAYLLSATVIEYLVDESGEFGLQRLLERWRSGRNFEQALIATYGLDTGQLETNWRRFVKRRYGWTVVLTQSAVFGVAAGAIILTFYLIRRRRDRRKLADLRAAELPALPAYWSEDAVEIIAHRGYSARAPESTIAALRMAVAAGATSLEFDLHVSADGVPVVIHDDTLERTTSGRGKVAAHTFAQLQQLDAGSWFSRDFVAERIASLEEVLELLRTRVRRIYIELKPHAFAPEHLDTVVDLIERAGMVENVVVMSFEWPLIKQVAARNGAITIAYLADDEESCLGALEILRSRPNTLLDCNFRILLKDPGLVRAAHAIGRDVVVYTVNDTATAAALLRIGVHRFTTNEVEKLLRWAAGQTTD